FIGKMMIFDLVWIMTGGGPLWPTETVSACIGSGASHAESQFMNKYQRRVPWQEAITLTNIAKKRSEVSPTVGTASNFFLIGRDAYKVFTAEINKHLDKIKKEQKKSTGMRRQRPSQRPGTFWRRCGGRHKAPQAPTAGPEEKKPEPDFES